MTIASRAIIIGTTALLLALAACGGGSSEEDAGNGTEIVNLTRTWSYLRGHDLSAMDVPGAPHHRPGFSVIDDSYDFGPALYPPPTRGPEILGEVYSNATGTSYGLKADSPNPLPQNGYALLTATTYEQNQFYKKTSPVAWVDLTVSAARIEAVSGNPWIPPGCTAQDGDPCWNSIVSWLDYSVQAIRVSDGVVLGQWNGSAELHGYQGSWKVIGTESRYMASDHLIWRTDDLELQPDVDGDGGFHAILQLKSPARFRVPLSQVGDQESFYIHASVVAVGFNGMQGESAVTAWLQDPVRSGGVDVVTEGVTPVPVPAVLAPVQPLQRVPECSTGTDPQAGAFELDATPIGVDEGRPVTVRVLRKGGSRGAASVVLSTRDGSARAGSDYLAKTVTLEFADGQWQDRYVDLSTLNDSELESDETFDLVLSNVHGCAVLGATTTTTVTIRDDDSRGLTYTVGGDVSGLAGSGLVLRDQVRGDSVTPANGAFTLPVARSSGSPYDIRVDTQPSNPIQICTVADGAGTIATANVTSIRVTCATPAPNGSLDPTFGSGGKVATNIAFAPAVVGAPVAMALQGDGRILLLGALKLLRFNSDGTLDASFGHAGQVDVPFDGSGFDTAQGLAVQADGRIVVVGFMSVAGQDDFALARFNADGTLDTTFGSGGRVTTDFKGLTDHARRVAIWPDGKIVVSGYATSGTLLTADTDFAVARYNTDGSIDATFNVGLGKTWTAIGGKIDWAQGMVLQADGKIVLVGRSAADGGSDPDIGMVRYHVNEPTEIDGSPDLSFGLMRNGTNRISFFGGWEEANDVVETPDGRLLVAGRIGAGAPFKFMLAQFSVSDGRPIGGPALADFSGQSDSARALALQSDGKIVVVGQVAGMSGNPDFGVVRYLASGSGFLDPAFGAGGKVTTDFFGAIDSAETVAIQPDGKIVVGGFARNGGTTVFALVRLVP